MTICDVIAEYRMRDPHFRKNLVKEIQALELQTIEYFSIGMYTIKNNVSIPEAELIEFGSIPRLKNSINEIEEIKQDTLNWIMYDIVPTSFHANIVRDRTYKQKIIDLIKEKNAKYIAINAVGIYATKYKTIDPSQQTKDKINEIKQHLSEYVNNSEIVLVGV